MDVEIRREMRKAIKSGDLKLVEEMIATYEGLIDTVTGYGTWLHVASNFGQLEIVQYLIELGLDVNQYGGSADGGPMQEAAFYGHLDVVKYLYEHGAKLDVSNAVRNPLFAAIYNGHMEVVKFLVEKGIDLTVGYNMGQLVNVDACEYARQYGKLEIRDYLLEKLGRK